jgi:hypothetical protein
MGMIRGLVAFAASIIAAYSFAMFAIPDIKERIPEVLIVDPMITLTLGVLLLSFWALLD